MLYSGTDQPARQITIPLRDDYGDVQLARQVSTRPDKIHAFFPKLTRERLRNGDQFIAFLEVVRLQRLADLLANPDCSRRWTELT